MPKQAKTLQAQELRRVLDYIATRPHALRNRTMLLATHLAGLRVGEVANLRYEDVVDAAGAAADAHRDVAGALRFSRASAGAARRLHARVCGCEL